MFKPKIDPLRDKTMVFLGPLETLFLKILVDFFQTLVDFHQILVEICGKHDPLRGKFSIVVILVPFLTYEFVPL